MLPLVKPSMNDIRAAVAPLVRPGTLLGRMRSTVEEVVRRRDGSGGTHEGGEGYLEQGESWPLCAHGTRMRVLFQVDLRDSLHASSACGLYVVWTCAAPIDVRQRWAERHAARACAAEIRFYSEPSGSRRRREPSAGSDDVWLLTPTESRLFHPDANLIESIAPASVRAALASLDHEVPWEVTYGRYFWQNRLGDALFEEHLGGWHQSTVERFMPELCGRCGAPLSLVIQLEAGDWWRSLFACEAHPDETQFVTIK